MTHGAALQDAIALASHRLAAAGVPSAAADALTLLARVLDVEAGEAERRRILGHSLAQDQAAQFAELVARRCTREPLQHIVGRVGFRRLELAVGPGVFVPRPETETVAGIVIEHLRDAGAGYPALVVDLCTGSGAIALAIKDEIPHARVEAVEESSRALAWARRNVEATQLQVTLHEHDAGDACRDLDGTVDAVVSNPPYIPPNARPLEVEVAAFDPDKALYGGGEDGLLLPRRIIERAAGLLRLGGMFVMEHAEVQGEVLLQLLGGDARWGEVVDHLDLAGRPRAIAARRTHAPREGF